MGTSFLFWNIDKRKILPLVARLAHHEAVDVLALAECEEDATTVVKALNRSLPARPFFAYDVRVCTKIKLFGRYEPSSVVATQGWTRATVNVFTLPGCIKLIFGAIHNVDPRNNSVTARLSQLKRFKEAIEKAEQETGVSNSLVVGDFNLNPFEPGVYNPQGLFAVMDPDVAAANQGKLAYQGESHSKFYNPCWRLMGTAHPYGTYFYEKGDPYERFFWNTFDQVALRPALSKRFYPEDLRVLTQAVGETLLNQHNRPAKESDGGVSDHLPLLFSLDLRAQTGATHD